MIIVDNALKARAAEGRPVRVGMIGAGFMARAIANQIINTTPGMRLVGVYARRLPQAVDAYQYADPSLAARTVRTPAELDTAIDAGTPVVTDDAMLLCRSGKIDAIIDATGAVDLGAQVALEAFAHGIHVIEMNAEVDGTLGPILQVHAKRHGVIMSACDGDQPAVQINLFRFVTGLGLIPRVLGNIKGLQDRYRTPLTQKGFAERWGQKPEMVTGFADGTKVNFEQAIVANATGMTVARRGMSMGMVHEAHVDELTRRYDIDQLRALGGIVDYVVGAKPAPGVYCLAEHPDRRHQHYLNLYKLGEGPLYSFYTPYHLCHFETPNTVARVVLFGDSAGSAVAPRVEVCAVAKRTLKAGEVLDNYGGFMTYGEAVSAAERRQGNLVPEGLIEGCTLLRDIAKDEVIAYADVQLPAGRLADRLYEEQVAHFDREPATI